MWIDRKKLMCLMLDRDMNIKDLTKESNVSRATISNIKHGRSCADETAEKIAKALNVPVTDLIEDRDPEAIKNF